MLGALQSAQQLVVSSRVIFLLAALNSHWMRDPSVLPLSQLHKSTLKAVEYVVSHLSLPEP